MEHCIFVYIIIESEEPVHLNLSLVLNNSSLQSLDRWNINVLNVREHLGLSTLLLVLLSGDSKSQSGWDTLDTSLPQSDIQLRVQSDVLCSHVQCGELLDLLHSSWSSSLELDTVQLKKAYNVSIDVLKTYLLVY